MTDSLSRSKGNGSFRELSSGASKMPNLNHREAGGKVYGTWALTLDESEFESQPCCLLTLVPCRKYLTCLITSYELSWVVYFISHRL